MDRLTTRFLHLPPARNGYTVRKKVAVPTRDGCVLASDHYVPAALEPLGTILVRTPYPRGFPVDVTHGSAFAARGYHVLVQSCRGTFGSSGSFEPMVREAQDAQDTVSWLRQQPWFDGRLGTLGGSYLGFTQWALLADPPPELRACVIAVGPHDMSRAMYGTGAFALSNFFGWTEAVSGPQDLGALRQLVHVATAHKRVQGGLHGLPLASAGEATLKGNAPWYRQWLSHEDVEDGFWGPYRHDGALRTSEVPTLLMGGWNDVFLEQTMEQYEELRSRKVDVALTVGPWKHMDLVAKAAGLVTQESLAWLDTHLAGSKEHPRSAPVRIFLTGGGEGWRDYPAWPPATHQETYYLGEDASLTSIPGDGTSTFRHDPADPTPALGGRLLDMRRAGVQDNSAHERRADVLTFTSPPLTRDLTILGAPQVDLALTVDNRHADVFVRLCDVDGRGKSHNFSDAFVRLDPKVPAGEEQQVVLRLDQCAHVLPVGHRLRLQVSGGAHPRYARNLGTGEPQADATRMLPQGHLIHHRDSRVVLPVDPQ